MIQKIIFPYKQTGRILKEYAIYVERLRTYAKQIPLKETVEKAVEHLPNLLYRDTAYGWIKYTLPV